MADTFDPYAKWLKIPAEEQPADHYRLLGLKRFEESKERIEDAVAKRAEFLQALSMGEYVADAQRILNEVARARISLVNPDKKAKYDAALREQIAKLEAAANDSQAESKPIPMAVPIQVEVDNETALHDLQMALQERERDAKTEARRSGPNKLVASGANPAQSGTDGAAVRSLGRTNMLPWLIVAIASLVVAGIGFVAWKNRTPDQQDLSNNQVEQLLANNDPKEIEPRVEPKAGKVSIKNGLEPETKAGSESKDPVVSESAVAKVDPPKSSNNLTTKVAANPLAIPITPPGHITWDKERPVARVKGNSLDVSTRGKLVEAVNAISSSHQGKAQIEKQNAVVNGVPFEARLLSDGEGGDSLNISQKTDRTDVGYDKILSEVSFGKSLSNLKIGAGKLKKGRTYLVQIWYVDDRKSQDERVMEFTDNFNHRIKLNDQFALGIFNADESGTQLIKASGLGKDVHLNAYQVREITAEDGKSLVPDPGVGPSALANRGSSKNAASSAKEPPKSVSTVAKPKAPAKPVLTLPKNPLEHLTRELGLPQIIHTDPYLVDELFIGEEKQLKAELVFLPKWSREKETFQLVSAENGWVFKRLDRENKSFDIAKLFFSDFHLYFQWLPDAQKTPSNNYLRNGLLRLTHGKQTILIALRHPISLKSLEKDGNRFQFEKDDYSVKFKADVEWVPLKSELKFSFIPNSAYKSFGDKQFPGNIYFKQEPQDRTMWVEVDGGIVGDRLGLDADLMAVGRDGRGYRLKKLKDLEGFYLEREQVVKKERTRVGKLTGKTRQKADAALAKLNRQLSVLKFNVETAQKLHKKWLGVKVSYQFGDREVIIAQTGWARQTHRSFIESRVPEFGDYELVYELNLDSLGKQIKYRTNLKNQIGKFDRIAYLLELQPKSGGPRYVFVSMDAFTDDVNKIGIPTAGSKAKFQQKVTGMNIYSNQQDKVIVKGEGLDSGYIEFCSTNYGPKNVKKVAGASDTVHDFGDEIQGRGDYGSMQIHNIASKQTIFAINNWKDGKNADVGIGNSKIGAKPATDWTFTKSANNFQRKRLRVYVRPVKPQ